MLISAIVPVVASACGPERIISYNMFSVYNHNMDHDPSVAMNVRYWQNFTGKHFSDEQILAQLENAGDYSPKANPLLEYMKQKRNNEAVEYLEKLRDMKLAAKLSEKNQWKYPSKEDLEKSKRLWAGVRDWATEKLKGRRNPLQSRYVLMAMRGCFYTDERNKMADLWVRYDRAIREADIHRQCEGYMANEWIRNGSVEKARDFYVKHGRLTDLRATFPQNVTTETFKKLFAQYPNSNSFPFVIQDYLNGLDSDLNPRNPEDKKAGADSAATRELRNFVTFATAVVKSNQSKMPALWLSAQGYALYLMGMKKEALESYYAAQKLRSPQRMAYNVRSLVLQVRSEIEPDYKSPKWEKYLTKELTWLHATATKEKCYRETEHTHFRNHYTDVAEKITRGTLVPRFLEAGQEVTALLLSSYVDELTTTQTVSNRRCTLVQRAPQAVNGDYGNSFFSLLDTISSEGAIAYYGVVAKGGGTEFEKSLLPLTYANASYVAEAIGTKFMRQFKFENAKNFLKEVDKEQTESMNIKPYLAYSTNEALWFNRNQKPDPKLQKKAATAKLTFCKEMQKKEKKLENMTRKNKSDAKYAALAYEMATAYTAASPVGKAWALTNYSWTSAPQPRQTAGNAYLKRAQQLLRASFNADKSDRNMVRCLAGLTTLSRMGVKDDEYAKMMDMLSRLSGTQAFEEHNLGRCDIINDYRNSH